MGLIVRNSVVWKVPSDMGVSGFFWDSECYSMIVVFLKKFSVG